jgi:small Trp-rich protein
MWLVWAGVILALLWYFEVGYFAQMSGWWVLAPFAAAFVWFEVFERYLGLDKKAAHDELARAKKTRIKKHMEQLKNYRVRR